MAGRTRAQAQASKRAIAALQDIPEAPMTIPEEARPIWVEVMSSVPIAHFRACDYGPIAAYCTSLAVLRKLEHIALGDPTNPKIMIGYLATLGRVSALASKLRLVPSTRDPRERVPHGETGAKKPAKGFLGQ